MTHKTQLPVVTEERVGVDTEEGPASVYCRRCGSLVPLERCGLCDELGAVEPAEAGALQVTCNHDGGLDEDEARALRSQLGKLVLADVRRSWFVTTRPWTSMADLVANAPQGTRWVVVSAPSGRLEGVLDLSKHVAGRGATAGDVMDPRCARLPFDAPVTDALERLAQGAPVVVITDAQGRAAGYVDLRCLADWLQPRTEREQTVPDGMYVFVGGQIERVG